jgi:hypothetical protein
MYYEKIRTKALEWTEETNSAGNGGMFRQKESKGQQNGSPQNHDMREQLPKVRGKESVLN